MCCIEYLRICTDETVLKSVESSDKKRHTPVCVCVCVWLYACSRMICIWVNGLGVRSVCYTGEGEVKRMCWKKCTDGAMCSGCSAIGWNEARTGVWI